MDCRSRGRFPERYSMLRTKKYPRSPTTDQASCSTVLRVRALSLGCGTKRQNRHMVLSYTLIYSHTEHTLSYSPTMYSHTRSYTLSPLIRLSYSRTLVLPYSHTTLLPCSHTPILSYSHTGAASASLQHSQAPLQPPLTQIPSSDPPAHRLVDGDAWVRKGGARGVGIG